MLRIIKQKAVCYKTKSYIWKLYKLSGSKSTWKRNKITKKK